MSTSIRNCLVQNKNYTSKQLHFIETENASSPANNLLFDNPFEIHDVQYRNKLTEHNNPEYHDIVDKPT